MYKRQTEKRIAELSAIFKRLYEDSVTGRISDAVSYTHLAEVFLPVKNIR